MQNLKILSLNCFGSPLSFNKRLRFSSIASQVDKFSPNLVLLQEVIFNENNRILKNNFESMGYKYLVDSNRFRCAGGLVLASKNVDLEETTFVKFNKQGSVLDYVLGDAILGKGFQTAVLRISGKRILVINTHLVSLYFKNISDNNFQNEQLKQIMDVAGSIEHDAVILGGDLNIDTSRASVLNEFMKSLDVYDTLSSKTNTFLNTNLNRKSNIISKILSGNKTCRPDYILIGKNIKKLKADVVFQEPVLIKGREYDLSDHYGIFVEVEI